MALGLLFSALSGAGKGLAASAEQDQRVSDEQRLMAERSRLDEEKTNRIAEAQAARQRQAGIKQGQDIDAATTSLQNERDAQAINAANGSQMSPADAQVLRNQPEARKAYGLLSPTRQTDLEDRATAAEKLGYLDAAKETRGALDTELRNQKYDQQSTDANRRMDISEANAKAQQEFNNKMETRRQNVAEADIAYRKARDVSLDAKSTQAAENARRAATVEAMKDVSKQAKETQLLLADPMKSEQEKGILKADLEALRLEERRFRNALAGAGIDGSAAPDKPFNPADFRTNKGDSGTPAKANVTTVKNPLQADKPARQEPARQESTRDMALRGIDAGINATVRQLTEANNRGDKAEAARLNEQLQIQQAAKARM